MSSSSKSNNNNNNSNTSTTVLLLAAGALVGASMTLLTTWMLTSSRCKTNHDETRRGVDVLDEKSNGQNNKSIQNAVTKSSSTSSHDAVVVANNKSTLPTALRQEQLSRHTLYFGATGMERLRHARICVVGVGGVGSHAVHMLARSGVGCIRLVDFDQVSLSSLNRHACATLQDVGTSKVECLTRYCRQLCPDTNNLELQPYCEMYTEQSGTRLLDPYYRHHDEDSGIENRQEQAPRQWDLVIDAIDDVPTKACLIADCLQRGIRVLSCMGAGGKCDFTRLHVSDLRGAVKDPLATKLRQALRKKMLHRGNETAKSGSNDNHQLENSNIKKKRKNSTKADNDADDSSFYLDDMERLAVVYSSEKPVCKLADFTPQQKQDGVHQYGAVDGMRIRILPVLGTMPAIMGQGLAAVALTELAAAASNNGKDRIDFLSPEDLPPPRMQPVTVERVSRNVRNRLLQRFTTREDQYGKRIIQEHGEKANTSATRDLASGGILFKIDAEDDNSTETIWIGPPQIDFDDVEYLMDVWRNRCAVTGARLGTVLELTRWDVSKPSTCDNVILVASHTLEKFQANTSMGTNNIEWIEPRIRQRVRLRLASCRISDSEA